MGNKVSPTSEGRKKRRQGRGQRDLFKDGEKSNCEVYADNLISAKWEASFEDPL